MSSAPKVAVHIPADVHQKVQERLRGSAFRSVDEFIEFLLARLAESPAHAGEPLSAKDEARLRERLKSLGYID